MDKVKSYTLSDEETEKWRRDDAVGEEFRAFSRKWMRRYEPAGTRIEVHSAWGDLLEAFEAKPA